MGIGRLLDISVRTMQAYQGAMDVSTNNISNAGNTDYTRQRVILAAEVGENGSGAGIKVQDVLRVRDDILAQQLIKYQTSLADSNKRSEILQKIEAIISEPSEEGLANYMTEFYNSWENLSANPTSTALRLSVIQSTQQLSEKIKDTIDGFSETQNTLQKESAQTVDQINAHLKNIFEMNQQIYQSQVRGIPASELMDSRDKAVDELSKLVNITVQKNDYGAVLVNVGGIYGADQTNYNQFDVQLVNGQLKMFSEADPNATAIINGGEFNAIADMYSNKISAYKTAYENLGTNLVDQVNAIHMQGFTLATGGVSQTGIPFFGELDANGKVVNAFVDGQLQINSAILNSSKNIAASSANANDGNNTIANRIAQSSRTKVTGLENQTTAEYYSSILNVIGMDKNLADNSISSNTMVVQSLSNQKASTSGVSLDEEMTNVMKYQRSYEAASKLIKIADELMQTIINMV